MNIQTIETNLKVSNDISHIRRRRKREKRFIPLYIQDVRIVLLSMFFSYIDVGEK